MLNYNSDFIFYDWGGYMTEADKRKLRCCFTGHRPEKINGSIKLIKSALEKQIHEAIADGFTVFISGMARGVDIWAAEIVLRLRNQGEPIHLMCAIPYKGFGENWSNAKCRTKYIQLIKNADLAGYLSPHYHPKCFQIRNEWMVNHSSKVIAVFNGKCGGTKNTIEYARKVGVPVVIIPA